MQAEHTQRMIRRIGLALVALMLLQGAAYANEPFDAVVTQDNVAARAGGHEAFYVVGRLAEGTPVRVQEVVWGWNRIVPPPGVHSFILAEQVDRDADDPTTGTVNVGSAEVRAAGLAGETEAYRVQGTIDRGQAVTIVERVGPYYKIEPPANALVWLPPGSVRHAADVQPHIPEQELNPELVEAAEQQAMPAEPADDEPADAEEPAAEPAANDEPSQADAAPADVELALPSRDERDEAARRAAEAQTPEQAVEQADRAERVTTPAVSDAAIAVEQRHASHFYLPVDEQPLERMRQDYQALLTRDDLPGIDRRVAQARLTAIEHNERLAATLRRISELTKQAGDDELIPEPENRPLQLADYTAIGQLRASSVYDGQSLPRLLRLVDPISGRTIAYIEPAPPVRTRHHLGQTLGIQGQIQRDPALNLPIIRAEQIDILQRQQLNDTISN